MNLKTELQWRMAYCYDKCPKRNNDGHECGLKFPEDISQMPDLCPDRWWLEVWRGDRDIDVEIPF